MTRLLCSGSSRAQHREAAAQGRRQCRAGNDGTGVAQVAAAQAVETQGSAVARARQRVDVQGSAPARALRRLGRGGDEVNEKPTPSPNFISLIRQPKGPFRYIANLSRNLLHLKIKFSALKLY